MAKYDLALMVDQDLLPEFQKNDEFLEFINTNPPEAWLSENTMNKGVKYMAIERVEWLLDRIFQQWHVEVLREATMFNSITCTVRLHYKHPINGWTYQDGLGAVPAKTSKGARASDMTEILSDAVQTGLPAAKSYAIKDAAEHIGKIFGRDINRKQALGFTASYTPDESQLTLDKIQRAKTTDELQEILVNLPVKGKQAYAQVIKNRMEVLNVKADTSGATKRALVPSTTR